MANIFKKRILDEKLKDFEIENFKEKIEIVKKWHDDYHNGTLKTDKETSREQAFNQDFFIKILGYQEKPETPYTLEPKQTTDKGQLPDLVLGYFEKENKKAGVVVELKGASIPLDRPQRREGNMSPIQQAFKYKNQYRSCPFVLASNFFEFRLFQDNQLDYEIWTLDDLVDSENDYYFFKKFCYLLCAENLIVKEGKSKIEELLSDIRIDEENISKSFYKEYRELRLDLLRDIYRKNNIARENIDLAIEKAQKVIDRIVFVCFCEDKGLLPEHILQRVLQSSENSFGSLWSNLKGFFEQIDKGSEKLEIPDGYNGGLFAKDNELDQLEISDEILKKLTQLGRYNFEEDMSVSILGHIFEQSISDLEDIKSKANSSNELNKGLQPLVQTQVQKESKRKKDGIFYTPDYIVDYIIKNSLGKYLSDKEEELKRKHNLKADIQDETYAKRERLVYDEYRQVLENVKVLDPACGSGAFLVKVFDFLLAENKRVSDILGGDLFSQEGFLRSILKNNIFGVDINQESVEITKLSLWLKTAVKGKKLTTLDGNIKCGNSLVSDPAVAGEKAFDWNKEFPEVFREKTLSAHHVTWVTHNSRVSQRMVDHKVKKGEAVWLDEKAEIEITKTIRDIVKEDNLKVLAYNICGDHVHMVLVCDAKDLSNIVRKLKGKSAQKYKEFLGISKDEVFHLWAQKFNNSVIENDGKFRNAVEYVENNRIKHELELNKGVETLISAEQGVATPCSNGKMICDLDEAFVLQYEGGFDVIVGNPPYVNIANIQDKKQREFLKNNFKTAKNKSDLYSFFTEKGIELLKKNGEFGFIFSNSWMGTDSFSKFREFLIENVKINSLVELPAGVFEDATVTTVLLFLSKKKAEKNHEIGIYKCVDKGFMKQNYTLSYERVINSPSYTMSFSPEIKFAVETVRLGEIAEFSLGIKTSNDKRFILSEKKDDDCYPVLRGKNISRYYAENPKEWIWYKPKLMMEKVGAGPRKLEYFLREKIIFQDVATKITATIDQNNYLTNDTISLIYDFNKNYNIKFVLTLLNSKLINKWFKTNFPFGLHIKINQLKDVPIPKNISSEEQKPFIEKADLMLELNKNFQDKKQKFINRLITNFDIEKLSKKLDNFYEIEFKDFVSELKKKKINLSLVQQDEWEDYFDDYKTELLKIKSEIDKTDKEIDELVYGIYGLSVEERGIVENG